MDPLDKGRNALASGDSADASASSKAARAAGQSPDALFGLGEALWWLGEIPEAVSYRERAYAALRRAGRDAEAFAAALRLTIDHRATLGNVSASGGWRRRAERLVEDGGLEPLRGWARLLAAYDASNPSSGERLAREALALAKDTDDLDLELSAASQIGVALIEQGRVEEGARWLDEAMAGALGGEAAEPGTVVFASCNTMVACSRCADFERAVHWIHAAARFADRFGCPFLHAECRTVYGDVLASTGDWRRAEDELTSAVAVSRGSLPTVHAQALAALARLRLDQGRLEEARHLLLGSEGLGPAVPIAARVELDCGRPARAAAMLRRRLDAVGGSHLEEALLLELLGEAALSAGDLAAAAEAERALSQRGEASDCQIMLARGERLRGRAALAGATREPDPLPDLEAALARFTRLGMPLEAGRTRLLLARAWPEEGREVAVGEARAALDVFERLGAARDADEAAAFLRSLGVKAARAAGRPAVNGLTRREREVLALLGEGLSNPEIGERLFISPKTAEHHVGRILAKLGVRSRAEAAAEAVRLGEAGSG